MKKENQDNQKQFGGAMAGWVLGKRNNGKCAEVRLMVGHLQGLQEI